MSRQQLERHLRKLREAREIMDAMKSLAFMETRRLTARLEVQQAMMHSLDTAVADRAGKSTSCWAPNAAFAATLTNGCCRRWSPPQPKRPT